jgi:hypothetical protein
MEPDFAFEMFNVTKTIVRPLTQRALDWLNANSFGTPLSEGRVMIETNQAQVLIVIMHEEGFELINAN